MNVTYCDQFIFYITLGVFYNANKSKLLTLIKKEFICSTVLQTVFVLFTSQLTTALPFSMTTSSPSSNANGENLPPKVIFKRVRQLQIQTECRSQYTRKDGWMKKVVFFSCLFSVNLSIEQFSVGIVRFVTSFISCFQSTCALTYTFDIDHQITSTF